MTDNNSNFEGQLKELKPLIEKCLELNHDLNNPLAGIIGYCEFLMDEGDNLSPDQISYLKQISKCADRIKTAIIELSEMKMQYSEKVDLKEFLESLEQESVG